MNVCTSCGEIISDGEVWVKAPYTKEFLLRCRECSKKDYENRMRVSIKEVFMYYWRMAKEIEAEKTAFVEEEKDEPLTGLYLYTAKEDKQT